MSFLWNQGCTKIVVVMYTVPKMMKPAYLFHNNFFCSGFCGQDVLTDCKVLWYSNSTHSVSVSSYQRSLSTSQPVAYPFRHTSSRCHLSFFVVSLLKKNREQRPACLMLYANTEISPLFCHSSLLRGIYPASKGTQSALVWWHGFNPQTIDFIKVIFFFPLFFILSNVHAGQLECGWKSALWVCQEEWNWELNTGIQTVNQRVLGCKLCVIANWVASALLLKSATFLFSCSNSGILGRKCLANR